MTGSMRIKLTGCFRAMPTGTRNIDASIISRQYGRVLLPLLQSVSPSDLRLLSLFKRQRGAGGIRYGSSQDFA